MDAKTVGTTEAARFLNISEEAVRRHAREGRIVAERVAGSWRFNEDSLIEHKRGGPVLTIDPMALDRASLGVVAALVSIWKGAAIGGFADAVSRAVSQAETRAMLQGVPGVRPQDPAVRLRVRDLDQLTWRSELRELLSAVDQLVLASSGSHPFLAARDWVQSIDDSLTRTDSIRRRDEVLIFAENAGVYTISSSARALGLDEDWLREAIASGELPGDLEADVINLVELVDALDAQNIAHKDVNELVDALRALAHTTSPLRDADDEGH